MADSRDIIQLQGELNKKFRRFIFKHSIKLNYECFTKDGVTKGTLFPIKNKNNLTKIYTEYTLVYGKNPTLEDYEKDNSDKTYYCCSYQELKEVAFFILKNEGFFNTNKKQEEQEELENISSYYQDNTFDY